MPADHPLAKYQEVVLAKVLNYPLLILDRYTKLISLIKEVSKRNMPAVYLTETTQLNTLLAMLDAGNGIAFLPRSMAQANAKFTRATLRISDISLTRRYGIVTQKNGQLSSASQSFINYLHQAYANTLVANTQTPQK